ncbi:MAG: hypothetical protein JNJ83_10020 [Verrucomicrobiaceae bacterium]|nr:hypothetical protein [Verrucomicrobiaceae bacterium]
MDRVPNIDEAFFANHVSGLTMDQLWAAGWRHQGTLFFRYDACEMQGAWHDIVPVRIRVGDFQMSKSHRRVWRKNADIRWEVGPAIIDEPTHEIFERHKTRFQDNIPESIHCFFTSQPHDTPCECLSLRAFLGNRLVAASFMDMGGLCTSSVYAIFDPAFARRGLGTLTLLKEVELTRKSGRTFLYPGYATREPSHYDYKKTFSALEGLHWPSSRWLDWDGSTPGPQLPDFD